jgi:hypothetical protein
MNYWDTCITHESSYLARLHYVHTNAVRHGLAMNPEDYPFCSYRWFLAKAEPQFRERVLASPLDKLNIRDDFWRAGGIAGLWIAPSCRRSAAEPLVGVPALPACCARAQGEPDGIRRGSAQGSLRLRRNALRGIYPAV